jgi:hypothetical protein
MATISRQGTAGSDMRVSRLTFEAASPNISMARMRAKPKHQIRFKLDSIVLRNEALACFRGFNHMTNANVVVTPHIGSWPSARPRRGSIG